MKTDYFGSHYGCLIVPVPTLLWSVMMLIVEWNNIFAWGVALAGVVLTSFYFVDAGVMR